jgi:hypothetical protein
MLTTEADRMNEQVEIFIDTGPTHNYDAARIEQIVTRSLLL